MPWFYPFKASLKDQSALPADVAVTVKLHRARGGTRAAEATPEPSSRGLRLCPGEQVGQYRLIGYIGSGSYGEVWKAVGAAGELVAVKFFAVNPSTDPTAARRFQVEIDALGRLLSPNVITIITAGDHRSIRFYVMPYVSGGCLKRYMGRGRPLSVPVAVRISHDVCTGLVACHDLGIVHRDVKPGNILIKCDPVPPLTRGRRRLKLIAAMVSDLGTVHLPTVNSLHLTATGHILGTPAFMPPEAWLGANTFGPAGDVYSAGAVMWVMLTGENARPILTGNPGLLARNPAVPAALSDLVGEMLAFDPEKRPKMDKVVVRLKAISGG